MLSEVVGIIRCMPFSFNEAVEAHRVASMQHTHAARALVEVRERAAHAEAVFRVALAAEIRRLHDVDGVAWSTAADLARGVPEIADLRATRDRAEGELEAAQHSAWRHVGDRRELNQLITWSRRG